MPIINLLNPKNVSLFIGIASAVLIIILFVGDKRKLTLKRIIALCVAGLLGFIYFFNQP